VTRVHSPALTAETMGYFKHMQKIIVITFALDFYRSNANLDFLIAR